MGEVKLFLAESLVALLAVEARLANLRSFPFALFAAAVERDVHVPLVRLEHVEALVVEHGHELQTRRHVALVLLVVEDVLAPFRLLDVERPSLLVAGLHLVAEGGPLQLQFLFGQGLRNLMPQRVAHAVLHPSEVELQLVAVFFLVAQFVGLHKVAH